GSDMRRRLERAFDRFRDLRSSSDAEAASAIHADGIDILVDLKGHTFRARTGIVALRPAPIQVSYLGYPGTMGADFIDYIVGDRVGRPPSTTRRGPESSRPPRRRATTPRSSSSSPTAIR